MSQVVIVCKGLPASGKSTWAREWCLEDTKHRKRLNKDSLRWMLDEYRFSRDNERMVEWARDALLEQLVGKGHSVVVDDTNLDPRHLQRIREVVGDRATVEVKFFDVGLDECLVRNEKRPEKERVPARVIKQMHRKWFHDEDRHEYREYVPGLPEALVCDVDGTLAIHNGRDPYDCSTCEEDGVNHPVLRTVMTLWDVVVDTVLIVSGRDERWRAKTIQWLVNSCGFPIEGYGETWFLFMRADDDKRNDSIVKQEIAERDIFPRWNVLAAFDDRNRVVRAWREIGVPCFQVADGDF